MREDGGTWYRPSYLLKAVPGTLSKKFMFCLKAGVSVSCLLFSLSERLTLLFKFSVKLLLTSNYFRYSLKRYLLNLSKLSVVFFAFCNSILNKNYTVSFRLKLTILIETRVTYIYVNMYGIKLLFIDNIKVLLRNLLVEPCQSIGGV